MKIRQVLEGLLSGQDFSDHGGRDEESDRFDGPLLPILPSHANCDFCAAWRAALALLALPVAPIGEFEAGDKVFLPGRIPGRVMGTDVTVRVEVQNGEHGPWAVGSFSPLALIARDDAPEFYTDRDGDLWKVTGEKTLSLCDKVTSAVLTGKFACILAEAHVREEYAPLTHTYPVRRTS